MTIQELEARQEEIKARLQELDSEYAGAQLPDAARQEWEVLNEERDKNVTLIEELHIRHSRLAELDDDAEARDEYKPEPQRPPLGFRTARSGAVRGDDIWDLSTVRMNYADPTSANLELMDRAMRAVDSVGIPHPEVDEAKAKEHIERLLRKFADDEETNQAPMFSRLILSTGSPMYRRAFGKYIAGRPLSDAEQRAASLTGSAGGFAVPYVLDPTIIPSSNGAINPWRAISRVEQIMVDEWRGVSSGAVTAAYAAEATEASDNMPTLAQPTISTERAQAFIPFSIEIGMDWGSFQSEMATLFQDAKDTLEATKFYNGGGTNEPFGVQTGLTTTVRQQTASTAAFAVADLDSLEAKLAPRYRPQAGMVMNRAIAQKVRRFDTAGGASLWVPNNQLGLANQFPAPGGYGYGLLGYPTSESTAMPAVLTSGSKIIIMGDFGRGFCIVERLGMTVEVIPHLFGSGNRFPTGQRGLYAFWRNSSKVLVEAAFAYLETL